MTLNQESGEKEWQVPLEKQTFAGDDEMYSITTVNNDGNEGELVVSERHRVYSSNTLSSDNGNDSFLSSPIINNLPLNSSGFVSASNFKNAFFDDSILRCGILNQMTENISSFENSKKSLSLVIKTRCSTLENAASLPLESPLGLEVMSNPCCLRKRTNLLSTFSSDKNLIFSGEIDDDIFSAFSDFSSVLECSSDMFFIQ